MKREIKIGLTVVIAIILLYLALAWASGNRIYAGNSVVYTIKFSNIIGLLEGDPVVFRGYDLGRVTQITPQPQHIEVTIELKSPIPLYTDAYAEIQPKELMGGKQIDLVQGNSGEILTGKELPGRAALDFSTGFSKMGDILKQIDTNTVYPVIKRMDTLVSAVNRLVLAVEPQSVSTSISLLEENLQLLRQLQSTIVQKEIPAKSDTFLTRLNTLSQIAQDRLVQIDAMLTQTDSILIPKVIGTTDSLNQLLSNTSTTLTYTQNLLESEESALGRLLHDQQTAIRLDSALINLNKVLIQIQEDKIIVGFRKRK